ncbi:MAG: sensor histidine kinase [Caulobacter sp.]|nr:sensor histidine kinase [Caulobacter sp.]
MQDNIPRGRETDLLVSGQGSRDPPVPDLARALEQKLALLHEVDHRVKNNLQLITSLLKLQARRSCDPAVKLALTGAQQRVSAVATVHRRLFRGEEVERFDVAAFVEDLVDDVIGGAGRGDIQVRLNLEPVDLPATQAAPLALLISELLVNAVRHAFPNGRSGLISISVGRDADGLRVEIADNGVGMGTPAAAPGFGGTIVTLLSGQLGARRETIDADPGVRTVIRLPVNGRP